MVSFLNFRSTDLTATVELDKAQPLMGLILAVWGANGLFLGQIMCSKGFIGPS